MSKLQKLKKKKKSMRQLKIGIVKLKKQTSLTIKRQLETFFNKEGLFLGWTGKEDGIVVSDLERAKKVVTSKNNVRS